jgi:hypothetical protein
MTQLVQDGLVVQDELAITLPRVYTTYQTPAAPKTQAPSSDVAAHRDGREVGPHSGCPCIRRQTDRSGTGQPRPLRITHRPQGPPETHAAHRRLPAISAQPGVNMYQWRRRRPPIPQPGIAVGSRVAPARTGDDDVGR